MAGTDTNSAQELIEAYNQAISSAFTVAGTNMAQATEAAKVVADAAQTERNEYGKTVEEAIGHSRKRGGEHRRRDALLHGHTGERRAVLQP